MFGRAYFGGGYFGSRYFGDGGSTPGGGGGGGADWSYVMSNGLTAEQNIVDIRAMLAAIVAGSTIVSANVKQVNSVGIIGAGVAGNSFRPS